MGLVLDLSLAALALAGSFRRPVCCRLPNPIWHPNLSKSSRKRLVVAPSFRLISSQSGDDGVIHDHHHHVNENKHDGVNSKDRMSHLYGFTRPDMYKDALHGTVSPYQKHVILCFGNPSNWPPQIETSPSTAFELPRLLAASLKAHKDQLPKKTRFSICKGSDDIEASRGDVLVFPDMVKYKDLGNSDIEGFVKEFLIHEGDCSPGRVEELNGFHIFVCAHGSRDMRCGVCGPALLERFEKEVSSRGLDGFVFVRPCSHVGGHKYAGNLIIYGKGANGKIAGHWYGYVTPNDVAILLDEHIGKGQIIHRLWRGQLDLAEKQ